MDSEVLSLLANLFPMIAVIVAVSVGGWVFTTWLRIKNGYPLETSWGTPLHPSNSREHGAVVEVRRRPIDHVQVHTPNGASAADSVNPQAQARAAARRSWIVRRSDLSRCSRR